MRKAESIFSLLIAVLCLGYLFFVHQMDDYGEITEPGAAFFPAVLGLLGLGVSLKIWISSMLKKEASKNAKIPREGQMRLFSYLVACLVFVPVFETLGAYVAIFALVLVLTKILGEKGWLRPLILAAASSVIAYLLFFIALDVPLPRGIF